MTRHRLAQIAENRNPKSPENWPQQAGFLQNRLLHRPDSLTQRQSVSRSSRTTIQDVQESLHQIGHVPQNHLASEEGTHRGDERQIPVNLSQLASNDKVAIF